MSLANSPSHDSKVQPWVPNALLMMSSGSGGVDIAGPRAELESQRCDHSEEDPHDRRRWRLLVAVSRVSWRHGV